ncbi:MAG: DUF2231 domain-containing protein [Balneolales bacterium]
MTRIFILVFFLLPAGLNAHGMQPLSEHAETLQAQEIVPESGEVSEIKLFIGRFHPILVHLPIGFLLFAFLLECAAMVKRYEQLNQAVPFALLMGGLSGLAAGLTGWLLSSAGGYGEEVLNTHKWLGLSVTGLAFLAFFIRIRLYDHPLWRKAYMATLACMVGTLIITGHYGGSLTHGSDYLYRYMPGTMRTVMGLQLEEEEETIELISNLDSALVYRDVIEPILRTRCQSCHNQDRKEGELLMTSFDHLMQGGENGKVVAAGYAGESELHKRLVLPASDDDRMPPKGRRQLTHDQINLIAWWIDQGAPSSSLVSELDATDDIAGVLHQLTEAGQSFFAKTIVPKADEGVLAALGEHGIKAVPVAQDLNFLQVKFSNTAGRISSEDMELLLPLSQQVTWLDLGRTSVSDSVLTRLDAFKNLTRLDLRNTAVGDGTLERAGSLQNLEYLNLYGTDITDEGLKHLGNNSKLASLYIWQTGVSQEAVQALKNRAPDLYINTGWERVESESAGGEDDETTEE